jgi:hypothetical protein
MGSGMLEEVGERPGGDPAPLFRFARADRHQGQATHNMTISFSEGELPPVDLLAETESLYRNAAEELARALRDIRQGRHGEVKAAAQAVRDLRAAFQMVQDERTRVDKLRKQAAGLADGHDLDFDAARAEIGRRLARLRDAGGH